MLDDILLSRLIKNIKTYSNGRETVFYGKDDAVSDILSQNGYNVRKVFTGREGLIKADPQKYIHFSQLKGQMDKYYVVIPQFAKDDASTQRQTMKKMGYAKYYDYVFAENDDNIERTLYNVEKYSLGRKVAFFGYDKNVDNEFQKHNVKISGRFTSSEQILSNAALKYEHCRGLKNRSSEYYVIFPTTNNDGGKWQRYIMGDYGYKENKDYCFYSPPKQHNINIDDNVYEDAEFASKLYIPPKYKKVWYDELKRNYHSTRKLNVVEAEGGIMLPVRYNEGKAQGGVCSSDGKFLAGHLSALNNKVQGYISSAYSVDKDKLDYSDETVVFGGVMFDHLGHLILECFAQRIWWYLKHPDSKLKCAVIGAWGNGSYRFIKEFFELFGMPEDQIIYVRKPTQFKKIIIPDQSLYVTDLSIPADYTDEYVSVFDYIKTRLNPSSAKKVYFTKSKTKKQDIIGENYFIEAYKKRGFTIVNPEDCTLREKAELLYGAEDFASQIGTNTEFVVFGKPDLRVQMLTRVNNKNFHISVQNITNNVAKITDLYIINASLNFLHRDFVWGVNLMGVTKEYISFAKALYNEDLDITQEQSLRNNSYDYLKRFSEYYSDQRLYNKIKDIKMLTVLDYMNEIFLNKEYDTSNIDTTTNENKLSDMLNNKSTYCEFLELLFVDLLSDNKVKRYLLKNKIQKISLMCDDAKAAKFLNRLFKLLNVDIVFTTPKTLCRELSEEEWNKCKKSDAVFSYNNSRDDPGMRDGIKAVDILDILCDKSYTVDLPSLQAIDSVLSDALSAELKAVREELSAQIEQLTGQISEYRVDLAGAKQLTQLQTQQLMLRINELQAEKDKLDADIGKVNCEKDSLTEKLNQSFEQHEILSNEHKALQAEYQSIQSERDKLQNETDRANEAAELAENALASANQELSRLKDRLYQMENSRSWRYTRIFRKRSADE